VFERFTERARQVVVLAQDEARTLEHGYSAPSTSCSEWHVRTRGWRGHAVAVGPSPSTGGPAAAQLVIACPNCATPIETITTDRPNTTFEVRAAGDRTCPVCGQAWQVSYNVSWHARDPTPPG
jgi:hypothetical protein